MAYRFRASSLLCYLSIPGEHFFLLTRTDTDLIKFMLFSVPRSCIYSKHLKHIQALDRSEFRVSIDPSSTNDQTKVHPLLSSNAVRSRQKIPKYQDFKTATTYDCNSTALTTYFSFISLFTCILHFLQLQFEKYNIWLLKYTYLLTKMKQNFT